MAVLLELNRGNLGRNMGSAHRATFFYNYKQVSSSSMVCTSQNALVLEGTTSTATPNISVDSYILLALRQQNNVSLCYCTDVACK